MQPHSVLCVQDKEHAEKAGIQFYSIYLIVYKLCKRSGTVVAKIVEKHLA